MAYSDLISIRWTGTEDDRTAVEQICLLKLEAARARIVGAACAIPAA